MQLWNVKLFDKTLVTVTKEETAKGLVSLLNDGSLHGVPGDPAAYESARGTKTPPDSEATVEKVAKPKGRKRPTK